MVNINNRVYKVTDKQTKKEYIGTTWSLSNQLYMEQGSICYLAKKGETRSYKCEYIGHLKKIYKVTYAGEIFEGNTKEIAEKYNLTVSTVREMFYRQRKGIATKLRLLGEKEVIVNGHQSM